MMVIAFGLFLLLPLVLLVASLGRTAVGMTRGEQAAAAVARETTLVEVVAPAPTLVEAPAAAAPRKRFGRRRRGGRHDYFGDAVASSRTSRLRNQAHAPAAPVLAPVSGDEDVAEAPAAPRPVVIPAPAPVFARSADAAAIAVRPLAAVARPIAPAGAEARLVLR